MNQESARQDARRAAETPVLLIGNGILATTLANALTGQGRHVHLARDLPGEVGHFGGVVTAHDVVDRDAVLATTRLALQHAMLHLPVLMMGEVAQVGPITRTSPAGACVLCADRRMKAVTGRSALDAAWPLTAPLAEQVVPHLCTWLADWDQARDRFSGRLAFIWAHGGQTEHFVLRTAACPICAGAAPAMPFAAPTPFVIDTEARPDAGLILREEARLIDPVTGPIRSVRTLDPVPGLPMIRHSVATLADPGWAQNGIAALDCGGNDLDAERARSAALGEAIERACASDVWPGHLTRGAWNDLDRNALDPETLDLFLPAERQRPGFPFVAPDRDAEGHWVWGTDLAQRQPILVPASHVFIPFQAPEPEPLTDHPLLSGYAAGPSRESALLSALLEVIERDTFMIAWANRLSLQPVDLDRSSGLQPFRHVFRDAGLEVRVGLIQLDLGAPVAIAMARSDAPEHPALVVGAAAAMTYDRACRKALGELTANWLNVHYKMATLPLPGSAAPETIRDEAAHGLLYARPDMRAEVDFWWHSETVPMLVPDENASARPPGQDCASLVRAMAAAGLSPIVVDLTLPDLEKLGLHTVKCIVPGAYPMNFDALWPHLGGRRMTEAPVRARLRHIATQESALNRTPHPFP